MRIGVALPSIQSVISWSSPTAPKSTGDGLREFFPGLGGDVEGIPPRNGLVDFSSV
jgi:hypothetical protein